VDSTPLSNDHRWNRASNSNQLKHLGVAPDGGAHCIHSNTLDQPGNLARIATCFQFTEIASSTGSSGMEHGTFKIPCHRFILNG
jgi:hypothetical protein